MLQIALAILASTYGLYAFLEMPYFRGFVEMSYRSGETGKYFHGFEDLKMVVTLINILMVLRWVCQELVFVPLALLVKPKMKASQLYKYKDMGFQLVWYTISWIASVYYLYTLTDGTFNLEMMWLGQNYATEAKNPHISSIFGFKLFYLCELAFWLHMILITMIEEKRKDFYVMMAHHFLTSGLIGVSYFQKILLWLVARCWRSKILLIYSCPWQSFSNTLAWITLLTLFSHFLLLHGSQQGTESSSTYFIITIMVKLL